MNAELKYGSATIALGGLLLNATPLHGTHLNDPPSPVVRSHNTVIPDVNINDFFVGNNIDYTGLLSALVTACNGGPETQLQTGPGIRVSNDATTSTKSMGPVTQAGSSRDSSVGDFSNDFVIWDSVNQQPKNADVAEVSGFQIKEQVGFDPGFSLEAKVEVIKTGKTSTVRTIDKTSDGESEPFLPGQTLGAGPGVGGHEIVLYVKTGEPKSGIALCDQNGWEFDGGGNIQYGFTLENVDLSVINRWMVFWAVEGVPLGLPPGSPTDPIVALCNTFDAEILEGDPVAIVLQVKQAAAEGGVTTGGLISCNAPARGCDTSEPGPPLVEESGNACSDGGSTNKVEPGFFATSIKSGGGTSALTNSTTSSTEDEESCFTTIFGKRYEYGPPC